MAWQGNGAENGGPGSARGNAAGRIGGPNGGPGFHGPTAANTSQKGVTGYRKGEPVYTRAPGGTTPVRQAPK